MLVPLRSSVVLYALSPRTYRDLQPTWAPATKLYSTLLVMGTRREAMWLTPSWAAPVPRASLMAVPLRHWTWMPYSSK